MNRKYKRRLVKMMYKVADCTALDEYGSRIFGRPIQGTWRLFRHIARMAISDKWGWSYEKERAIYPGMVDVPTLEEFATFMFHEVAHGWCYFLKSDLSSLNYPTGVDEEQVCWDVSKMVCEMLDITYQKELAELSYQFYCLWRADDKEGASQLLDKMPEHLQS